MNRILVRLEITLRIGFGEGGFTQHVIGISKPPNFHVLRSFQGFMNGFASDKLLAQHLHGQLHATANQRLTLFANQAREGIEQLTFTVGGHQLAGQHQTP